MKFHRSRTLVIFSVLLSISVLLSGCDKRPVPGTSAGAESSIVPDSVVVDKEDFISNFGCWCTLSNLRFETEETPDGPVQFLRVDAHCVDERDFNGELVLKVEIHRNGDVLNILESRIAPLDKGQMSECSVARRVRPDDDNLQYFGYLALKKSGRFQVPVSGIISPGGGRTSQVPVSYPRRMESSPLIELTNAEITLGGEISGRNDHFRCDYECSNEFMLNYRPGSGGKEYFIHLVDQYGRRALYKAEDLFQKQEGEISFGQHWLTAEQGLTPLFRQRPLSVYVSRDEDHSSDDYRLSVITPRDVYSNVLEIED